MAGAHRYLEQVYMKQHHAEFAVPATAGGSAFIPYIGGRLPRRITKRTIHVLYNQTLLLARNIKTEFISSL